jgi:two-component system, LuxR family, response regulator FixJ
LLIGEVVPMALKSAKVYVIDGDAASRENVTMLVRTLGLEVPSFDSAESFLSTYDGYRPGCIVADMRMLGMSGNDLLLELRRRGLTIPVIILTAHADTPTTVLVMKNGAFTTLDKPCKNAELWDAIRTALHEDIKRSEEDKRRQEARQRLAQLTPPERDVLKRLLAGDAHKVIALRLDMGLRTVEARRRRVFRKTKVDSIAELVKLVMLAEPELLPPEPTE